MPTDAVLSSQKWAELQVGSADFGDARLTRRAVKILAGMALNPSASIPQQAGTRKDTKPAYRFFDTDSVGFNAVQAPHFQATLAAAGQHNVTLQIQDSSQLGWPAGTQTRGLGSIGYGHTDKGLMLHTTLAVVPGQRSSPRQSKPDPATSTSPSPSADPVSIPAPTMVLGLSHQKLWARQKAPKGESRGDRRVRDNEADRWSDAVRAVGAPPPGKRFVHIGDRESDIFELFDTCRTVGCNFVIRGNGSAAKRSAYAGHAPQAGQGHKPLIDLAEALPQIGSKTLEIRARTGRSARTAKLNIAAGKVTLLAPALTKKDPAAPVQAWVVRVWEPSPGKGITPLEWLLITDMPVNDEADAQRMISWYELRWLIEEYHKCIKTGCQVEARQLEEAERLERLIAMLTLVAVKLLQLKSAGLEDPDSPATERVEVEHVQTLAKLQKKPMKFYSNYEFWRQVASLGGFMGRKGDGEPGWQTLWHGWEKLQMMTIGFRLASG